MLAMLFEMTSTLVCCASIPVPAMCRERMVGPLRLSCACAGCARRRACSRSPSRSAKFTAFWNSRTSSVMRTISITGWTLLPSTAPCTTPGAAIGSGRLLGGEQPVALGPQLLRRLEPHHAQAADGAILRPDGAVALDLDAAVAGAERDGRAAGVQHRIALRIHQAAVLAQGEAAGAGEALLAAAVSTAKKPSPRNATSSGLPVWSAGPAASPARWRGRRYRRCPGRATPRRRVAGRKGEDRALRLEARRVGIGEVVRQHLRRALLRAEAGENDVAGRIHAGSPCGRRRPGARSRHPKRKPPCQPWGALRPAGPAGRGRICRPARPALPPQGFLNPARAGCASKGRGVAGCRRRLSEVGSGGAAKGGKRKLLLLAVPVVLAAIGAGLWFSGILPELLGKGAGAACGRRARRHAAGAGLLRHAGDRRQHERHRPPRQLHRLQQQLELSKPEDVAAVQAAMPRLLDLYPPT